MKVCLNLLPFTWLMATVTLQAEPTFEIFSYTGKDLFPSAIISTATVDWAAFEEEAEEAGAEEAEEESTEDEAEVEAEPEEEETPSGEEEATEEGTEESEEAEEEPPVLGDRNGWLGVALTDVPEGATIKVEMTGDGWMKPSRFVGKAVGEDGELLQGNIDVMPKGVWDYSSLRKIREQEPVNLTVKVTINGTELPEQSETMVMRSMNDCPFFVIHGEEDIEDISWCFAAYVNENHPWIDGILKEALGTAKDAEGDPLITSFTGYQSGDSEEVLKQVFAIWQVLQRRGIKYSDVSTTVPSKTVVSQVVRFVDETVDAKQANCVDGSVLMASILTKIGLNAYLVMVPRHCYLAFDEAPGGESVVGLETTMLGQDNLRSIDDLQAAQELDEDAENLQGLVAEEAEASMKTFLNAIETGNSSLEEHAEGFKSGEDPNIQLVSIAEWRKLGIMPLASGKERR